MKTFRFFNHADANYTFEIEAESEQEALGKALVFLGWNGPCPHDDADDEDEDEG